MCHRYNITYMYNIKRKKNRITQLCKYYGFGLLLFFSLNDYKQLNIHYKHKMVSHFLFAKLEVESTIFHLM